MIVAETIASLLQEGVNANFNLQKLISQPLREWTV